MFLLYKHAKLYLFTGTWYINIENQLYIACDHVYTLYKKEKYSFLNIIFFSKKLVQNLAGRVMRNIDNTLNGLSDFHIKLCITADCAPFLNFLHSLSGVLFYKKLFLYWMRCVLGGPSLCRSCICQCNFQPICSSNEQVIDWILHILCRSILSCHLRRFPVSEPEIYQQISDSR